MTVKTEAGKMMTRTMVTDGGDTCDVDVRAWGGRLQENQNTMTTTAMHMIPGTPTPALLPCDCKPYGSCWHQNDLLI